MSRDTVLAWWFRGTMVARNRAIAGCLVLAVAALAATAIWNSVSSSGAAEAMQPRPANTDKFEAFVQQVGIDMAAVPVEVRREWANAPRIIIDDCGIPGAHEPHGHSSSQ